MGRAGERDLPRHGDEGGGPRAAVHLGRVRPRHAEGQQARPGRARPPSRPQGARVDRGRHREDDQGLRGRGEAAGGRVPGHPGPARRQGVRPQLLPGRQPGDRGRPRHRQDRQAPARRPVRPQSLAGPDAGVVPLVLCDVGPRDGLQNEPETLAPAVRAELAGRLAAAGLPRVEAVSFVRDDRVPQMAGAEEVASLLPRNGAEWSGLVLNERGYDRFLAAGLDRVNLTLAATETFNRRNGNMSLEEAVAGVSRVLDRAAADGVPATVTLSVAFGCPFEGRVDPDAVLRLLDRLEGAGEVVLADTIGVATPGQVRSLVERASRPGGGFHAHNTRNTGYANALAAVEAGAEVLDASVGGIGGCPFAPRATGNVATEDLVYLLHGEGIETGVDLDALVDVSAWLEELLGRTLPGYVYRARPSTTPV